MNQYPPLTVEQADIILERNLQLLELLTAGKEGKVLLGCPHCMEATEGSKLHFDCRGCAWSDIEVPTLALYGNKCTVALFGGYSLSDVAPPVRYGTSTAEIHKLTQCSPEDIEHAKAFLQGHIDWALEVINGTT